MYLFPTINTWVVYDITRPTFTQVNKFLMKRSKLQYRDSEKEKTKQNLYIHLAWSTSEQTNTHTMYKNDMLKHNRPTSHYVWIKTSSERVWTIYNTKIKILWLCISNPQIMKKLRKPIRGILIVSTLTQVSLFSNKMSRRSQQWPHYLYIDRYLP